MAYPNTYGTPAHRRAKGRKTKSQGVARRHPLGFIPDTEEPSSTTKAAAQVYALTQNEPDVDLNGLPFKRGFAPSPSPGFPEPTTSPAYQPQIERPAQGVDAYRQNLMEGTGPTYNPLLFARRQYDEHVPDEVQDVLEQGGRVLQREADEFTDAPFAYVGDVAGSVHQGIADLASDGIDIVADLAEEGYDRARDAASNLLNFFEDFLSGFESMSPEEQRSFVLNTASAVAGMVPILMPYIAAIELARAGYSAAQEIDLTEFGEGKIDAADAMALGSVAVTAASFLPILRSIRKARRTWRESKTIAKIGRSQRGARGGRRDDLFQNREGARLVDDDYFQVNTVRDGALLDPHSWNVADLVGGVIRGGAKLSNNPHLRGLAKGALQEVFYNAIGQAIDRAIDLGFDFASDGEIDDPIVWSDVIDKRKLASASISGAASGFSSSYTGSSIQPYIQLFTDTTAHSVDKFLNRLISGTDYTWRDLLVAAGVDVSIAWMNGVLPPAIEYALFGWVNKKRWSTQKRERVLRRAKIIAWELTKLAISQLEKRIYADDSLSHLDN